MPSAHAASKKLAESTYAQYKETLPEGDNDSKASSSMRPAATTAVPLNVSAPEGIQAFGQRRPRHHHRTYLCAPNEFALHTTENAASSSTTSAAKNPLPVSLPNSRPLPHPPQQHEYPLFFGWNEVPLRNGRPHHHNAQGAVTWKKPTRPAVPPPPLAPHHRSRHLEVNQGVHVAPSPSTTPQTTSTAAPICSTTPETGKAPCEKSSVHPPQVPGSSNMTANQGNEDYGYLSNLGCNAGLPGADTKVTSGKPTPITSKSWSPEYLAYIDRCEKDLEEQERGAGQATAGKSQQHMEKVDDRSTVQQARVPGSLDSTEDCSHHASTEAPTDLITPETAGVPVQVLRIAPSFSINPFRSNPGGLESDPNWSAKIGPAPDVTLPGWDIFKVNIKCDSVSLTAPNKLQERLARAEKEIERLRGEKKAWEEEKSRFEQMTMETKKTLAEKELANQNKSTEEKQLLQEKDVMDETKLIGVKKFIKEQKVKEEKNMLIGAKTLLERKKSTEKKQKTTTDIKGKQNKNAAVEDDWVVLEEEDEIFV
ncbi:MAG: hypothetical protein Q9213_003528 [Squamulea squamosa]